MTLDGSSIVAFVFRSDLSFWVKKKILFTLRSMTLSHPVSEKSSSGSPHAAPALFIR